MIISTHLQRQQSVNDALNKVAEDLLPFLFYQKEEYNYFPPLALASRSCPQRYSKPIETFTSGTLAIATQTKITSSSPAGASVSLVNTKIFKTNWNVHERDSKAT